MHFGKKFIRDNRFTNKILRHIVRGIIHFFPSMVWLKMKFRVYGPVTQNVHGVNVTFYNEADDHLASELFYDPGSMDDELDVILHLITQSRYFIDVGANTGIYSVIAAKKYPALSVMSIEPHPSNFSRLTKNVTLNGLGNIEAHALALGQSSGQIELSIPADDSVTTISSPVSAFTGNFYEMPLKKITVAQTTLDDLLQGCRLTSKDLVKIDVEYYELSVLAGATITLRETRPMVFIEILHYDDLARNHPGMRDQIDKNHATSILQIFSQAKYTPYFLKNRKNLTRIESSKVLTYQNMLFIPDEVHVGSDL